MNFKGIIFFLGIFSFLISFFSILNILYSFYFNLFLDINSYILTFFISFFLGLLLCYVGKNEKNKISLYDQIILIIVGYFYLSFLISIPYILSSYKFTLIDSYFESISGFTGTGFSIINDLTYIDESLKIWRSNSQWIGGLFFLISIISTLGVKKIKIKPFYLFPSSYEGGIFFKRFFYNSSKILYLYSTFTIVSFLLFVLSDIRIFDSFNLALTVVSAGGFVTQNHLADIINNNFKTFVLSITLLFPIFNAYLFYNFFTNKINIKDHSEDFHLLVISILTFLILFFFVIPNEKIANIFLLVTSSLSTSGISIYSSNVDLSLLLILLTIIGGSVFSASSGFKYARFYILFKTSINEIYNLAKPKQVFNKTFFKTNNLIEENDIKISFLVFIFFILQIFVLSGIITLNDINFESSFKLSIITLTNTASSSMFALDNFNFLDLNNITKIFLILFMILGKLELIAFLMLIKKFIFRE